MRSTLLASSLLLVGLVGCEDPAKKPADTATPSTTPPAVSAPAETPKGGGGMEGPAAVAPAPTPDAKPAEPAPAPAEAKPADAPKAQ